MISAEACGVCGVGVTGDSGGQSLLSRANSMCKSPGLLRAILDKLGLMNCLVRPVEEETG